MARTAQIQLHFKLRQFKQINIQYLVYSEPIVEMLEQTIKALQMTLVPDKDIVKASSDQLDNMRLVDGFCLTLMSIADNADLPADIRQAALIQLKINVQRVWIFSRLWSPKKLVSEEQKAQVRKYLFPAMIRWKDSRKFIMLYKAIIKSLITHDYEIWLPIQEISNILINDPPNIPCALHFTMGILEGFEAFHSECKPYHLKFLKDVFPLLLNIIKNNPSLEMIYRIIKTSSIGLKPSLSCGSQELSMSWIPVYIHVINHQDQQWQSQLDEHDIKDSAPYYYHHAKKWAAKALNRFLQRHANTNFDKDCKPFAEVFFNRFGETIVQMLINQLAIPAMPKTKYMMLKSLTYICDTQPAFIDGFARQLLYNRLPQMLILTEDDDQMAKTDPVEFLSRQEDPWQNCTNTKYAATNLWISLNEIGSSDKKKAYKMGKYLMQSMEYLKNKLESTNLLEKQMAMYLICKMERIIARAQEISKHIPTLISTYILPQINHPQLLIRARTVDVFIQYGDMSFPDQGMVQKSVEMIYNCLANDSSKVVNFKAACAFNRVLSHQSAANLVKPHLNKILQIYIKLLNEFDNQELVVSLREIVSKFSSSIGPYARQLIHHLSNIFIKYCVMDNERATQDNYNGDTEMSAAGCLNAITQLLDSKIPISCIPAIEEDIVKVVSFCMVQANYDHFNDAMSVFTAFLYKVPAISARVWFFFPTLIYFVIGLREGDQPMSLQQFNENQVDIFLNLKRVRLEDVDAIMPALRLFVSKGLVLIMGGEKDYFGRSLLLLIFEMADTIYRTTPDNQFHETDEQRATITALILYIVECVDNNAELVKLALKIVKANLEREDSANFLQLMNCQLLCVCYYRLPTITAHELETSHLTAKAFTLILTNQSRFSDDFQRKRVLLGLSSMLRCIRPINYICFLTPIFNMCDKQVTDIHKMREQDVSAPVEQTSEEDDADETNAGFDDYDDDNEFQWGEGHDNNFIDHLEDIDEVAHFEQTIVVLQASDPEVYKDIEKIISVEQRQKLVNNINSSKIAFSRIKEQRAKFLASSQKLC